MTWKNRSQHWPECLWMLLVLLTAFRALSSAFAGSAIPQANNDAGELVSVEHSDGPSIRYVYRKDGALMEAAADEVVVRF